MKKRTVEIYVGYTDKTWDTQSVDVPGVTTILEAQRFALSEFRASLDYAEDMGIGVAFTGLYFVGSIEEGDK